MKEVWKKTSTNGRWGVSVVCDQKIEEDSSLIQGTVKHLGKVEGHEVFQLIPSQEKTWVLLGDDVAVLSGGTVIYKTGLQSSRVATIALLSSQAVIETSGYKGRSSHISCLIEGEEKHIPASCLLAMGLIKGDEGEVIKVEAPPAIESNMLAALKSAGLA